MPLGKDPRACFTETSSSIAGTIEAITKRKDVISAIGKIGGLDVLNDIGRGASKVGQGIRVLGQLNSVIGSGVGSVVQGITGPISVPSFIQLGLDKGANAVAGIVDPTGVLREYVGRIDPVALNGVRSQFKTIYGQVTQGNFSIKDAPKLLSTIISAEKNIQQQVRGLLGDKSPLSTLGNQQLPLLSDCSMATPYAMLLASDFAPKFKFMFVVEFEFSPDVVTALGPGFASNLTKKAAFLVKSASRPTYTVEYEDVNLYGYKTGVAKTTRYEPVTFAFYDDNKDHILNFFETITRMLIPQTTMVKTNDVKVFENFPFGDLKPGATMGSEGFTPSGAFGLSVPELSPISLSVEQAVASGAVPNSFAAGSTALSSLGSSALGDLSNVGQTISVPGIVGDNIEVFDFPQVPGIGEALPVVNLKKIQLKEKRKGRERTLPYEAGYDGYYGAALGTLPAGATTLFSSITIHHIYDYGASSTTYTYIEPQLTSMELSALDMADSEPCEVTMEFRYGALRTQVGLIAQENDSRTARDEKADQTTDPKLGSIYSGNGDMAHSTLGVIPGSKMS